MSNKEAMNQLVKLLTAGDDDMKRQLTTAQVRRIFKNFSVTLFNEGCQMWSDITPGEPNYVSHALVFAMYSNGKRLSKKSRSK